VIKLTRSGPSRENEVRIPGDQQVASRVRVPEEPEAFRIKRPDRELAADALAAILAALGPAKRQSVLRGALAVVTAISDNEVRAHALVTLAAFLPVTLFRDAFAAATAISDDHFRAIALGGLAPFLPVTSRLGALLAADVEVLPVVAGNLNSLYNSNTTEPGSRGQTNEDNRTGEQTVVGRLADALPPDVILDSWLAAKGVTEDERPFYIAKFNQLVVVRRKWVDREKYPELQHLSAPRFLRAVYADVIDAAGRLTNEEVVRLSDPKLVRIVQGYINKRVDRRLSLGDAEGLIFKRKDDRGGRSKKPKARKNRTRALTPG
jgi:hypothetical protein